MSHSPDDYSTITIKFGTEAYKVRYKILQRKVVGSPAMTLPELSVYEAARETLSERANTQYAAKRLHQIIDKITSLVEADDSVIKRFMTSAKQKNEAAEIAAQRANSYAKIAHAQVNKADKSERELLLKKALEASENSQLALAIASDASQAYASLLSSRFKAPVGRELSIVSAAVPTTLVSPPPVNSTQPNETIVDYIRRTSSAVETAEKKIMQGTFELSYIDTYYDAIVDSLEATNPNAYIAQDEGFKQHVANIHNSMIGRYNTLVELCYTSRHDGNIRRSDPNLDTLREFLSALYNTKGGQRFRGRASPSKRDSGKQARAHPMGAPKPRAAKPKK